MAVSCRVKNVQKVNVQTVDSDDDSDKSLFCGEVKSEYATEWIEKINIESKNVKCKLDTGAEISVTPSRVFENLNRKLNLKLYETNVKIQSFSGENVKPLGIINLKCTFKDKTCYENFVTVDTNTVLLGLPGCVSQGLVKRVHTAKIQSNKEEFIKSNIEVCEGIGRLPGTVDIPNKFSDEQICHPSPRLPSCLLEPLKLELKRLEERKSLMKVDSIDESACVNRMVIVEKPNGKVRLCLDPSDLNKIIVKKPKMMPTLEDLSVKLGGKKFFSVLDLAEGFHHLSLSEKSSWKCCFATPFGVYRYVVLPYGLMNAPELFQDVIEGHFGTIPNVVVWADDILVMGSTERDHDNTLKEVIQKAKDLGIVFNKDKFQHKQTEVKFKRTHK